jgi:hypothetical protein
LYAEGLALHLEHFNRQKCDVVFKGKKALPQLKRYLRFLESLGLEGKEFQWVVRQIDSPQVALPAWCAGLAARWAPQTVKRIGPPALKKASSYAKWIGVQSIDRSGSGTATGKFMATVMFLARIANAASAGASGTTSI